MYFAANIDSNFPSFEINDVLIKRIFSLFKSKAVIYDNFLTLRPAVLFDYFDFPILNAPRETFKLKSSFNLKS